MKTLTNNHKRGWTAVLLTCLIAARMGGTPPFGFNSQTYRGKIADNIGVQQWFPGPLFSLLIQSSNEQWGFDVVQGTTEFAPMDGMGRPSQSGWHDHPTALSIGLVIQGTVWSHAAGSNCLVAFPTGSVFFERSGHIHNNYNIDPNTPAVVRIIHFVERNQNATRRDQPDPATGSTTTTAPPPPPCPAATASGGDHQQHAGVAPAAGPAPSDTRASEGAGERDVDGRAAAGGDRR